MQYAEFVSVYPSELTEKEVHRGPVPELMAEARELSYVFGLALHGHLSYPTAVPTQEFNAFLQEYAVWTRDSLDGLENRLWDMRTPDSFKAISELNFHNLNSRMLGAWSRVFSGGTKFEQPSKIRQFITRGQNLIALDGLEYYRRRENLMGVANDYPYFSAENEEFRNTSEGILTEYDTALVLLELMRRHPQFSAISAPIQFEHGRAAGATNYRNQSAYNVDFVGLFGRQEAVGIQAKAKSGALTRSQYDEERVMIVDGTTDLHNHLARRITPGSSKISKIRWGGILCAQRVLSIPTNGPAANDLRRRGYSPQKMVNAKILARQMTGTITPKFEDAVHAVGSKMKQYIGGLVVAS